MVSGFQSVSISGVGQLFHLYAQPLYVPIGAEGNSLNTDTTGHKSGIRKEEGYHFDM